MVTPVSLTGDGRHQGIITSSREIYCVPSPESHGDDDRIMRTTTRARNPRPSQMGDGQFVNVPHCEAIRSAPRCDRAKIVNVGFEAPSVGKMPGPATHRFGISWLWP